jgi:hypothetical protein
MEICSSATVSSNTLAMFAPAIQEPSLGYLP